MAKAQTLRPLPLRTGAVVRVAVLLLLGHARTAPTAALRARVVALAAPELGPASTRQRALGPGCPLAPASVDKATVHRLTLKHAGLAGTGGGGRLNISNIDIKRTQTLHFTVFCLCFQCQSWYKVMNLSKHVLYLYQFLQSLVMVSPGLIYSQSEGPGHTHDALLASLPPGKNQTRERDVKVEKEQ